MCKSQSSAWLQSELRIMEARVPLKFSTSPLDEGCRAVVLAFAMCRSRHTSWKRVLSKLRPWSEWTSSGAPKRHTNRNSICLLVRQRECLDPACEIITNDYQVFVSLSRHWQGTHYINCHPVKWGADSVILECSPMFPMSCFASLTSVTECDVLLDVRTHPIPVESLTNPLEGLTLTKLGREESVMGVPQDVCLVGSRD